MSQRNIFKSPLPPTQRSMSKGKASIHPSPRGILREAYGPKPEDSSLTPPKNNHLTEVSNATQNILKGMQQPLQFSASRKVKSKLPSHHPSPNSNIHLASSSVYTVNNGQPTVQISKFNNENQGYEVSAYSYSIKNDPNDLQKLRSYYQNQMRIFMDSQKNMSADYELKVKNMEKQKNYWRQSYMKVKQQYQQLAKNHEDKDKHNINKSKQKNKPVCQEYNFTLNRPNLQKNNQVTILQQTISNLQIQLQQGSKSLKVAEDQIYYLNKQKADTQYQLTYLRQENRRTNCKIFQLQYQCEKKDKQLKELKNKIDKLNEEKLLIGVANSFQFKGQNNLGNSLDLRMSIGNQAQHKNGNEQQRVSSHQRSNSSSGSRSRSSNSPSPISVSTSFSSKNKVSTHHRHRSQSNNSHNRHHLIHPPHEAIAPHPIHINFDNGKQFERIKHSYRKLQKTMSNQNQQIIVEGLRKLNEKYMAQQMNNNINSSCLYYAKSNKIIPYTYQSKINDGNSNIYSFAVNQSQVFDSKIARYW